jgi:hypothetical protein
MSHLSLFEKGLSLYQSRIVLKKKIFKNTNIEQVIVTHLSSNFQSSSHCILLNLSLFIAEVILSLFLLTAAVNLRQTQ